jgi:hypothetical protein
MNEPIKLFDTDGHITDAGFAALINDSPDELARLELSEHLDFCDRCVDRYSALLLEPLLKEPAEPIASSVMSRLKRRANITVLGRTTKVAVAACLTLVIWMGGIFRGNALETSDAFVRKAQTRENSFSVSMHGFGQDLQDFFRQWSLFLKGDNNYEK